MCSSYGFKKISIILFCSRGTLQKATSSQLQIKLQLPETKPYKCSIATSLSLEIVTMFHFITRCVLF